MSWNKFDWSRFGGVAVRETGSSVRELIKISLVELVQGEGVTAHSKLGAEGKCVAILVR